MTADLKALMAELREMHAETSPGPWGTFEDGGLVINGPVHNVCTLESEGHEDADGNFIVSAHRELPAILAALDAATAERSLLEVHLWNISGALVDASTIPVGDESTYADGVRKLTAERDTAHHLLADVCRCFEAADAVHVLHEAQTSAKYKATMDAVRALWLNASPPPAAGPPGEPDAAGRGKT